MTDPTYDFSTLPAALRQQTTIIPCPHLGSRVVVLHTVPLWRGYSLRACTTCLADLCLRGATQINKATIAQASESEPQ